MRGMESFKMGHSYANKKIYIIKYICIPILNGETYKAIFQNKADFIISFDRILISLVLFFVIFTWHHR